MKRDRNFPSQHIKIQVMKVSVGKVYKNKYGEYYTPAMSRDFGIVDMWKCNKNSWIGDIKRNPCPMPQSTEDLKYVSESKYSYSYPEGGEL